MNLVTPKVLRIRSTFFTWQMYVRISAFLFYAAVWPLFLLTGQGVYICISYVIMNTYSRYMKRYGDEEVILCSVQNVVLKM